MKHPKAELYGSPISLPEGRSGRFAVAHTRFLPERGPVALVSMREALLTGRRAVSVKLKEPLLVHQLLEYRREDDGTEVEAVWMSDEPQELRQAAEWIVAAKPRGRILVGGLGLGVVASWLAQLPFVEEVVVVEREQDVIDLVRPHQTGYTVERSDLFDYLRNLSRWRFDFAFFDIWQGTNESTWWSTVMPLRRVVGNRFGRRRVACWAESIMLGQVRRQIVLGNTIPQARCWKYAGLPVPMDELQVDHFLSCIGTPSWERLWGLKVDNADRAVPLRPVVGG